MAAAVLAAFAVLRAVVVEKAGNVAINLAAVATRMAVVSFIQTHFSIVNPSLTYAHHSCLAKPHSESSLQRSVRPSKPLLLDQRVAESFPIHLVAPGDAFQGFGKFALRDFGCGLLLMQEPRANLELRPLHVSNPSIIYPQCVQTSLDTHPLRPLLNPEWGCTLNC